MRENSFVRIGLLVIAASALLWIGAELSRRIEWILPYTAGAGAFLMLIGLFAELRRYKSATLAVAKYEAATKGKQL